MKKRITAAFVALILLLSLSACGAKEAAGDDTIEDKYIPVEIKKVIKSSISNMWTLSGKVYPDKDVMVLPKTPGKVNSLKVKVGDVVKKDQLLFTLDKEDIQKQVDMAKVSYDLAKASYEMNLQKYENSKLNFERMKTLYEHGAISRQQYEQAELGASEVQLDLYKAQYNQAQIAYNQAVSALENCSIKSPVAGTVASVNVEVGEMASSAQPAVSIINMDTVYVEINVTENMVKDLTENQEVKVYIESLSNEAYSGKIHSISPSSDARTQLYPVKVEINNGDHKIKPGMFAKVELSTDTREDAVIVNSEAVLERDGKRVVYVVEEDLAMAKEVVVGLDSGSLIEIKSGLTEGERVIVRGQDYVESGTKVKVVRGDE